MLSGDGKDWSQGTRTNQVESGAVCQSTRMLTRREMGSTVETWPGDWRNGPDVDSHAAAQTSPSPCCCSSYTFLFIKLVLLCLFCATAVSVTSDDRFFHPSPLCWPVLEMEALAYSREVSIAIYKVQRIAIQSIQGTWDALLAEEQTWLRMDLPTDSTSVSYLYPSSLSHVWFPEGVCFLMTHFEIITRVINLLTRFLLSERHPGCTE